MRKLLYFLAALLLVLSCEKDNGSNTITLDTLVESTASKSEDGSYILGMALKGDSYTVKLAVKSSDMNLSAGTYEPGKNGCTVKINDGYKDMNVSGGTVDISGNKDSYTIQISVISRNEEYNFKFQGAVEFKTFVGTVIRDLAISSTYKGRTMKYSIYLPIEYGSGKDFPVLYLLHGYGDDQNSWLDKGLLAKYVDTYERNGGRPMIIVTPDGLTDFYYGAFEEYFFKELIPEIESKYDVIADANHRTVAGLSMGGYGSIYYWSKYSDMFCYAYPMSPAVDVNGTSKIMVGKDKSKLPGLTIETGIQDFVTSLSSVTEFHDYLVKEGIKHEFITRDGMHDWTFWQECLPKVLKKCGEAYKD